ncbi:hypothetical protein [Sulfitobacter sp.]|uniref:hypothetical protein n=1 Tax=Sulfitobacter sp. TaxID=1903071 RepID=UPI00300363B9
MRTDRSQSSILIAALAGVPLTIAGLSAAPALAQDLLSYDDLSFFEEGLSTDIGGATLSFNALIDQAYLARPSTLSDRSRTTLQAGVSLETQLSNGWDVALRYTGIFVHQGRSQTTHRFAAFVGDRWGTLGVGNVTELLEARVSRRNRVGNAALRLSRGLGGPTESGFLYRQTFNAYNVNLAFDDAGHGQFGVIFNQPISFGNYIFGARIGTGSIQDRTLGFGTGETTEAALIVGYSYGPFNVGFEAGAQDVTPTGAIQSDRQEFVSVGMDYKRSRTAVSLEFGQSHYLGTEYRSAALGMRQDFARGFSANFGLNYLDNGTASNFRMPLSLRYEF